GDHRDLHSFPTRRSSDLHAGDRGPDERAQGALHHRDRHPQHAAGGAGERVHGLLQPHRRRSARPADRVQPDREDLQQPRREGDRGLHLRSLRLIGVGQVHGGAVGLGFAAVVVSGAGASLAAGAPIVTGTTPENPGPSTSWTASPIESLGCSAAPGTAAATVRACSAAFGPKRTRVWLTAPGSLPTVPTPKPWARIWSATWLARPVVPVPLRTSTVIVLGAAVSGWSPAGAADPCASADALGWSVGAAASPPFCSAADGSAAASTSGGSCVRSITWSNSDRVP